MRERLLLKLEAIFSSGKPLLKCVKRANVKKCSKSTWQASIYTPGQTWGEKCPKPSWQAFTPPSLSGNVHIWKQHISKRGFPCSCCFPFFPTKRYLPRNILLLVHLVIFSIVVVSAPHCIECSLFQLFQALNMRIISIWRKS